MKAVRVLYRMTTLDEGSTRSLLETDTEVAAKFADAQCPSAVPEENMLAKARKVLGNAMNDKQQIASQACSCSIIAQLLTHVCRTCNPHPAKIHGHSRSVISFLYFCVDILLPLLQPLTASLNLRLWHFSR